MVGTADSVLIREVSIIQSVLFREVPLYCNVNGYTEFDWSVSFYILNTWDKQLEIDCSYVCAHITAQEH